MKNSAIVLLSLFFTFGFTACMKDTPDQEPVLTPKSLELNANAPEVIANGNEFGVELSDK